MFYPSRVFMMEAIIQCKMCHKGTLVPYIKDVPTEKQTRFVCSYCGEAVGIYRRTIDMNECKCFSTPPGTPFEEGKRYYWQNCIDGIIVFNESGVQWSADGFDFYKYFSPIIQRKKIEAGE